MAPLPGRMGALDALKGFACVFIVWHHLAFYGPMSDLARPLAPGLIDWLRLHARMGVQVFLVVSGFVMAASVGLRRWPAGTALQWLGRRYLRLVAPYTLALVFAIVAAAFARLWLDHPTVPDAPEWPQLLAHLVFAQDLLALEALSAGIWYVAIDFQLFVLAVALCLVARRLQCWAPLRHTAPEVWLIATVTAASLFFFNRERQLDVTALYFVGAYGLGVLSNWAGRSRRPAVGLAALAVLGVAALAWDWRARIAVALVTALGLGLLLASGALERWRAAPWMLHLGRMSYPVFLVHFPVYLVVSAVWAAFGSTQPVWNALGMVLAFALSLVLGDALQRLERGLARPRMAVGMQLAVLATGLFVIA